MKTNPFAGLMAGFRGARADDENNEDEEARQARRAEEDQRREEEDARRAEEDERRQEEDARRAEEEGDDQTDQTGKDGKKAKGEEQDPENDADDDADDAEDGMDEKEAAAFRRGLAVGRARENARSTRIFSNPAAAGRAVFAATLAFTTRNSSAEATRLLGATKAEQPKRRGSLDDRMSERRDPRPGGEGGQGGRTTGSKLADQMIAVGRRLGQMPAAD